MHDDDLDEELAELVSDEETEEMNEEDWRGHTLSIRRGGAEVLNISSVNSGHEWSVYMQPGGEISNAYLGTREDSPVWVDSFGHRVERDEDGTYVIHLD